MIAPLWPVASLVEFGELIRQVGDARLWRSSFFRSRDRPMPIPHLQEEPKARQDDAAQLCGPYVSDHAKIHSCRVTCQANLVSQCRGRQRRPRITTCVSAKRPPTHALRICRLPSTGSHLTPPMGLVSSSRRTECIRNHNEAGPDGSILGCSP